MYEFLTGPMLWAAFLIFVIGLARRVVLYIRGLDWRLERVAYGPGRKIGMKGAISSVLQWLVPFGTHSWRRQPYFTIAFFLFHIGVVIVPLFLAGHMVIMQERFGFSLPSLPMWFSDAFTVLAIVGAFMMILRRVALPEVRFLTTLGDWGILLLVLFVLVAGFPFGNMYVFIRSLSYACPGGDGVGNTKSAVGSANGQGLRAGALRGPGPQVLFSSH